MKHVTVTGRTGYIAAALRAYLSLFQDDYTVDMLDLRDPAWQTNDFSRWDVIVFASGLAHVKETKNNVAAYDAVNHALPVAVAQKAKASGVKQFIYLSSMSVYGLVEGEVTPATKPCPNTAYGASKWAAEKELFALETRSFHVATLRSPMVYGEGCKGNYQTLVKLARVLPACPMYENQRSHIAIERLCEIVRDVIDAERRGAVLPQDDEYGCTCDMIAEIAKRNGRHLIRTRLLNFVPAILRRCTAKGRKAFGNLIYTPLPNGKILQADEEAA